eukprot:1189523-Prorocentrum_minimum.AAC.3
MNISSPGFTAPHLYMSVRSFPGASVATLGLTRTLSPTPKGRGASSISEGLAAQFNLLINMTNMFYRN